MIQPPLCLKIRDRRITMDLMTRWSTTVRNRKVPILVFMVTLATDDRDKEMTIIWKFMFPLGYHILWGIVTRMLWGLLGHFDRHMLFPLCFWSTRDHSSQAESTYEEYLCVVAITSSERGTQSHLACLYFFVWSAVCSSSIFRWIPVSRTRWIMSKISTMVVLSAPVSILNPNPMYVFTTTTRCPVP